MALLFVAACTATEPLRPPPPAPDLPPMRQFSGSPAPLPTRPNTQVARDFLDLAFRLETGEALPVLTRFEQPVTIRVTGPAPPTLERDLDALIRRLKREAGISVIRVPAGGPAQITVQPVTRRELQRSVPGAACFVVPRVQSWAEFRNRRNRRALDWSTLNRRETAAIFLPADVSPQDVRDCLHEELAQALGPLNDLYRLPDSIFNDDNIHAVLTSFDMLILRAFYAPELQNGMTREEAARRLPALLARLNPAGEHVQAP
ncbi:DUF2927 domain-containing protein, partial [Rhodovulum imhoffii]